MNGIQLPAGVSRNKQIAANMTMWGPHQEERSPYLHLKIAHSSHFGIWQGHNPISGSMVPHQSEDLSQNDFLLNGQPILSLYFNFVFINLSEVCVWLSKKIIKIIGLEANAPPHIFTDPSAPVH